MPWGEIWKVWSVYIMGAAIFAFLFGVDHDHEPDPEDNLTFSYLGAMIWPITIILFVVVWAYGFGRWLRGAR